MSSASSVDMDEILDQGPVQSDDASNDGPHSEDASYAVYIQFINGTERFLDVIWIDYNGQWIRYETLSPGEVYEVYTYVTHPWIFLDAESGSRMEVVGRGKVFYPLMSDIRQEIDEDGVGHLMPTRVILTVPVFSLKERCIEEICKYVDNKEDFDDLPIPKELVHEIKKAYDIPSSYAVVDSTLLDTTTDEEEATIAEEDEFDDDENEAGDADAEGEFTEDGDDVTETESEEWDGESEAYFSNPDVVSDLHEDMTNPYRDLILPSGSTPARTPSSNTSSSASVTGRSTPPPAVLPRVQKRVKTPPENSSDDDAVVADDERNDDEDDDEDSYHSAQETLK